MRFERRYYKPILKALRKRVDMFIADLRNGGVDQARANLNASVSMEDMGGVLREMFVNAAYSSAVMVYRQLGKEQKGFGDWVGRILDYFNRHMFDFLMRIDETTKSLLMYYMQRMISEGQGIDWLALQMEGMTVRRARMIARTESTRAINYGSHFGAENHGFETDKIWVTVHDDRVRHSHYLLDGKQVSLDSEFKQNLSFPGDPKAPAHEVVNCRCYLDYVGVRDSNGRLKPKETLPQLSATERIRAREIQRLINSN